MRTDFCIFVLTHGRAGRVVTPRALRTFKYTGKIYFVVDDEDKDLDAYRKLYGKRVLVFSKAAIAARFDEGDNFADRRTVFYARNACFDFAKQLGVRYFMQCDDDYSGFYIRVNQAGVYGVWRADRLDDVLTAMIALLASTPALTVCMSQGGDHIGDSTKHKTSFTVPLRKAMNTFLCDVERPFSFIGRVNEDVNTYVDAARRGDLMLTIPNIQVNQTQSQSNPGGMTDLYLDWGTYVKSFYSVMYVPSAVKIGALSGSRSHGKGKPVGPREWRVHHAINWSNAAAQIIDEKYRKP